MSEDRSDSDQAPFDPSFHTVERFKFFFLPPETLASYLGHKSLPEMKMGFEKTDPV